MGNLFRFRTRRFRRGRARKSSFSPFVAVWVLAGLAVLAFFALPQLQNGALFATGYAMCGQPPHFNCVIDGDTFYQQRQSIRIADIDTPETRGARCAYEAKLGAQATDRLLELLNAGPFELQLSGSRDEDQYGRKLRIVVRDGRSLGGILVSEGLARQWTGRRLPWCN